MNRAFVAEPSCPAPPVRSSHMHASTRGAAGAALHDYPPVDKPDRLPLRQRWHAIDKARLPTGTGAGRGGGG